MILISNVGVRNVFIMREVEIRTITTVGIDDVTDERRETVSI
jgi:hypothetical protein